MIYVSWDKKLSSDLRKKLFATKDRVLRARGGALWETVKRLKTKSAQLTAAEFKRPSKDYKGVPSKLIKLRIVPFFASETVAGVRIKDTAGANISVGRFPQDQLEKGLDTTRTKTTVGGFLFQERLARKGQNLKEAYTNAKEKNASRLLSKRHSTSPRHGKTSTLSSDPYRL